MGHKKWPQLRNATLSIRQKLKHWLFTTSSLVPREIVSFLCVMKLGLGHEQEVCGPMIIVVT